VTSHVTARTFPPTSSSMRRAVSWLLSCEMSTITTFAPSRPRQRGGAADARSGLGNEGGFSSYRLCGVTTSSFLPRSFDLKQKAERVSSCAFHGSPPAAAFELRRQSLGRMDRPGCMRSHSDRARRIRPRRGMQAAESGGLHRNLTCRPPHNRRRFPRPPRKVSQPGFDVKKKSTMRHLCYDLRRESREVHVP